MPELWRRTIWLLLWGWMPAGIAWQLLNADRLDFYSMLGWFVWPVAPAIYLILGLLRRLVVGRAAARKGDSPVDQDRR
jgi:hypothetical protein